MIIGDAIWCGESEGVCDFARMGQRWCERADIRIFFLSVPGCSRVAILDFDGIGLPIADIFYYYYWRVYKIKLEMM